MEAKLGFSGYRGYQTVFSKTMNLTESQESVVPDSLPDIAAILYTSGSVLIRSKDVAEGHVRLEANVPARVFCAGEGGEQTFCMDVNVPFYLSAEEASICEDSVCCAELTLRRLESRMLNPRKISVRAELEAEITCYAERSESLSTAPEEENSIIHALEREAELTVISCVTEKTFVLTDEFELPAEQNPAKEIVAQEADVLVQELRSVGSKLILKGCVRSELMFLCEDGALESASFQTAFSQIVEMQTETDDALCETAILKSGMYYELTPGADGKRISMELHLVAQAVLSTRKQLRYLADVYSNAYALTLQRAELPVTLYERETLLRDTCSAVIDTAGEVGAVISCHASPLSWSAEDNGITVQLLVHLCWRCGGAICSAERTVSQRIATDYMRSEIKICGVTVQEAGAAPGGGGIELRLSLEVRAFLHRTETLDTISAVEYDDTKPLDLDDRPTLVILYPRIHGDLWSLAKENCSTVEAIRSANALAEGEVPADRILLIPKTI